MAWGWVEEAAAPPEKNPGYAAEQNIRSLNNKLNNFICNIQCDNYDFLVLTETWFKSEVLDSELGFHKYNIFRCDRNNLTSN
jgi:hypothetical protein